MNRQIQILKKDLIKANERLAAQTTTPPQTASLALPATPTVAAAQPPPASFVPPQRPQAVAPPPQPMVPAPMPQYVQDYPPFYRHEDPQYFRCQDRRQDRRSVRCFLCDEEGHFALPEPAALQRPDLPNPGSPVQSQEPPVNHRRASRKPSRKRRRNCSTAVFRPAKRSPPRGHW